VKINAEVFQSRYVVTSLNFNGKSDTVKMGAIYPPKVLRPKYETARFLNREEFITTLSV